jgi:hypothetical protein
VSAVARLAVVAAAFLLGFLLGATAQANWETDIEWEV